MGANFESGFFVRYPAWHGLGTVINEAPNSNDALRIAGLDWDVYQTPAYVAINGEQKKTDYLVNYRSSDQTVLGMVKHQYKVVQNKDAFNFTDQLIGSGEVRYETAGSLAGGKQVWMLAKMPETSVLGDAIVPYLLFSNSHDGGSSVRVTMTNTRVVCQNTLNIALAGARRIWSFTHKGDMESKLDEARRTLQNAKTYMKEFDIEAQRLVGIKYSPADVKNIIDKLFPIEDESEIAQRKLNNLIYLRENFQLAMNRPDISEFKNTAYGILNAASDFAGHTSPLRITDTYQEKLLGSFMNGNKFLDMTYDLISA